MVVADGVTTQVAVFVLAQVPPVQLKVDAGVLQLVVKVEVPPRLTVAGEAIKTQEIVGVTAVVTVKSALAILPAPAALLPLTV